MNLFCLPYAGGSEITYYEWKKYLDPSIQLKPISLKGRGKRFTEGFYNSIEEAVDDIFSNYISQSKDEDYAIFGHSMGGLLAYELYYKICEKNFKLPTHMFFSGYESPDKSTDVDISYTLPDKEFLNKVFELGGTEKEIIENEELLELYLPILRNDFRILDQYVYKNKGFKIRCNVSVLIGKEDRVDKEKLLSWSNLVDIPVNFYTFNGNHFYINTSTKQLIDVINKTLCGNKGGFTL